MYYTYTQMRTQISYEMLNTPIESSQKGHFISVRLRFSRFSLFSCGCASSMEHCVMLLLGKGGNGDDAVFQLQVIQMII